ncbi:MAG: hypothetical protein KC635_00370 [Myxococcales bacterium]|nr:hypothetical protein [Myxococcales bacterium]MCB9736557.1 hypothetical protein [Deltaproteobacteria bacterium]
MVSNLQRKQAPAGARGADALEGGVSDRASGLRGLGLDAQEQALAPGAQPDVAAQEGALAPIQMKEGHRDGSKVPEYDFKSLAVHSMDIDKFGVTVKATITLKDGKDVITTELDATTESFPNPKTMMAGIVAQVEEKLSARGQKALLNALVAAYKKEAGKPKKDEDGEG